MTPRYEFKRVDDVSALSCFRCGVKSMDDFIHDSVNGLPKFVRLGLSKLWLVCNDGRVVAFFSLSKDSLVLNSEDQRSIEAADGLTWIADDNDFDKFWDKEKYPAVEIDYLAVSEEMRGNQIGSLIIAAIADKALHDNLSSTLFLTVEALHTNEYSAVEFYRKCGFEFSDVAQNKYNFDAIYNTMPLTRRMYKILIPDSAL